MSTQTHSEESKTNENEEKTENTEEITIEDLKSKGLNENMAKAIFEKNYEGIAKNIDLIVSEEIEKRLATNIPKVKQTDDIANQMKKFESMGYKDRLELSKKNPRLYKELAEKSMQLGEVL